ncbi:MAG TPA: TetR/AcrR family transcriptional regulator [Acidimicrobiales bacterium]|nr:TetR/AcrR family transcriptional regulator [Acidimicrobiales bacterium]
MTRIVGAAWDVLVRTGYDNLKVQMVARRAGVSIGSFYRHFGGKKELMASLCREELIRATAILDELTATGTPEERVRAWVAAVVSLRYGHRAGPRARWITTLPAEVRDLAIDGNDPDVDTGRPLRAAIADGVRDGSFPAADPERGGMLVQGLCSWIDQDHGRPPGDRESVVAAVTEFVLAALTNPTRRLVSRKVEAPVNLG